MEDGPVSHSWRMCVVSHRYGGLGGGGMKVVVVKRERQMRKIWSHVFPSAGEDTDDSLSHHLPGAQLWVGSSRNWSVFRGRN